MPDLTQLALYFAAALVLAVTPGPGIFYVAARTLAGGRAEGVVSSFGTGLGGMVHVLAGSLGVSAIVLASAELFTALKLIGAAYLVWIGFPHVPVRPPGRVDGFERWFRGAGAGSAARVP
jgi:threonine/homoserine/homoserine lactone efflux protein